MLNKKGMSLLELIIAVALISIVIVFLYSLLSDLNNEITNGNIAIDNQINRFEIIETVQNDALGEKIGNIIKSGDNKTITITYVSGLSTVIEVENSSIIVTDKLGTKTKWIMHNNCYIGLSDITNTSDSIGYIVNIPIYTSNDTNNSADTDTKKDNNNELDDITFVFLE